MAIAIYQVDAFTDRPFAGNPAGVCPLPAFPAADWMRAVAAEMNLAETAFVVRHESPAGGGVELDLRWFTPTIEVKLCGHATLAAAHLLWEIGAVPAGEGITFHTLSGPLGAVPAGDWIELDFPAEPPAPLATPPDGLAAMLGATPLWVGANRFDLVVEVTAEEVVRDLAPDIRRLKALPYRGVQVTAAAAPGSLADGYDFVSRFFAPAAGVDEDPVTGSAHCCLGPFWSGRLGRKALVGRQLSARGGTVRVETLGERVSLGGQAVTVIRGELVGSATTF